MRALDPEVKEAVWRAIEPVIPVPVDRHPLGTHRRRKSDRACFEVMLVRLVTGCSWEDAERLCGNIVSDTTVRTPSRRMDRGRRLRADRERGTARLRQGDRSLFRRRRGRRLVAQSPSWRPGNGEEPDRSSKGRMEMVDRHRSRRHPLWMDDRRREPQRLRPPRPDARGRKRAWMARASADDLARSRLRLRRNAASASRRSTSTTR